MSLAVPFAVMAFWPNPPGAYTGVEVFEDGSGIQYVNDIEVRSFGDGTFVWNCHSMGNFECTGSEQSNLTYSEYLTERMACTTDECIESTNP